MRRVLPLCLRNASLILGGWAIVGLVSASATVAAVRRGGGEASWWLTFGQQMVFWLAWAALSPVVYRQVRCHPLRGGAWWRPLLRHVAIGLAWMAVYGTFTVAVTAYQYGIPRQALRDALPRILDTRFVLDGLYYCGLVAVCHLLVLRRTLAVRERERAELDLDTERLRRQLADARLDALRAQLHPHFLFNSLNTISGLIRGGDHAAAVEVVARLGEVLRYALESADQPFVPLATELAYADSALAVHRARFPGGLGFVPSIADETRDTPVPALLLQPLLENAIVHGVAAGAGGTIELRATRRADGLRLELSNPIAEHRRHRGHGIGLATTRERLRLLYGRDVPVELKREEGRATVSVTLPVEVPRSAA